MSRLDDKALQPERWRQSPTRFGAIDYDTQQGETGPRRVLRQEHVRCRIQRTVSQPTLLIAMGPPIHALT